MIMAGQIVVAGNDYVGWALYDGVTQERVCEQGAKVQVYMYEDVAYAAAEEMMAR
jgi:hypothetical protein